MNSKKLVLAMREAERYSIDEIYFNGRYAYVVGNKYQNVLPQYTNVSEVQDLVLKLAHKVGYRHAMTAWTGKDSHGRDHWRLKLYS